MNIRYMGVYCTRCNGRGTEHVLEHETGHIIEICRCNVMNRGGFRMWNRSTNKPVKHVIYYTDEQLYEITAGADKVSKVKS